MASKARKKKKAKKATRAVKARKAPARKAKAKTTKKTRKAGKAKARTAAKATRKAAPRKAAARKPAAKQKMVGEGDYQASRSFLKDQSSFVKKNEARIPAMGKQAEMALEGPEGADLRAAEAEAASHSRAAQ